VWRVADLPQGHRQKDVTGFLLTLLRGLDVLIEINWGRQSLLHLLSL
jgi:hypothetical protein